MEENPVRRLRKAMGLNQHKFADLVGRSYASIQGYESGKFVPPDVVERLKSLSAERGLAHIALELSSQEWQVRHVLQPGETLITTARDPAASPSDAEYHAMLDEIFASGNDDAIEAVQKNIIVFRAYVRSKREQKQQGGHRAK